MFVFSKLIENKNYGAKKKTFYESPYGQNFFLVDFGEFFSLGLGDKKKNKKALKMLCFFLFFFYIFGAFF